MKGIGNFVSIRHVRQLRSMSSCLLTRPSTRTTIHLYFSPRVSHSDSSPPSPSSSMFSVYKFFFSLKCVLILWEIFFFVFFFCLFLGHSIFCCVGALNCADATQGPLWFQISIASTINIQVAAVQSVSTPEREKGRQGKKHIN